MKIAVFGRSASTSNIEALQSLCKVMLDRKVDVIVDRAFWNSVESINHSIICAYDLFDDFHSIRSEIDYVFSIGGDGTLLNTVDLVLGTKIPVVGINTGRLGYLAHFSVQEVEDVVTAIQNNEYENDIRQLLQVNCSQPIFQQNQHALNEFTIQKKDPSSVIKVHAYLDQQFLSSYWADGVIVSTPTGSTGYSLSAGGPIILPKNNAFVITPIAAHNLNQRPIIVNHDSIIDLKIERHRGESYCTVDSKYWSIEEDVQFQLSVSPHQINILRPKQTSYTDTLRNKLMWGLDNRNN